MMNRWTPFVSLVLVLASAVPATAQCPVNIDNVDVVLRAGTPPTNDTNRREHIRISDAVADALCINPASVDANGNDSPQIRVEITDDPTTTSAVHSSALFTITSIDNDPVTGRELRIEIWNREDADDTDNGLMKLFPNFSPTNPITGAEATVYRIAPSRTTQIHHSFGARLNPVTQVHYNEPVNNGDRRFEEFVEIGGDHEIAVLMPHGGNIETDLSDLLWRIDLGIDNQTGRQADIWEGVGVWGEGQTSRRWHVTSASFSPDSFPGLALLTDQAAVNPYQYAVAVHGFTGRTASSSATSGAFKGVVIGGQASLDEKCSIAREIQNRYVSRRSEVAITIFYRENGVNKALEVPALQGTKREVLLGVTHLRGLEDDNIVNRLSPNPTFAPGRGAFQFELSQELRNDVQLLEATMSGIGNRLGKLYNYPPDAVGACGTLTYP